MDKNSRKPRGLTGKQKKFIHEYIIDSNATQAAIRAGYSEKTARFISAENLTKPNIKKEIDKAFEEKRKVSSITAEYVLGVIQATIERCSTPEKYNPMAVLKGTEQLGKHLKLFVDKIEHEHTVKPMVMINVHKRPDRAD